MAGHSHWATIKRKKGKEDAKRGKIFTRIGREIMVAAREGGGDPGGNPRLRLLIDKAKAVNMPNDNINRAIKRGTGELAGAMYEPMQYEGYGPEGIAVIVDTLTDNKNRTVADVRHIFAKNGGKLAESGSVSWMFERKGAIFIASDGLDEDMVMEKLLDYNIDDIAKDNDLIAVYCELSDLEQVKAGALAAGLPIDSAEPEWIAKDVISPSSTEVQDKVLKLLEALEDLDDVQDVYTNMA